jgi:NTP pyrophosphatase (non-canonical NTP hydrolase)
MDFTEYQKRADDTAIYPAKHSIAGLMYCSLGLAGEVGELCNKVKKIYRDHGSIITDEIILDLEKEIGDCQWYLAQLCTELSSDLSNVALKNVLKLAYRKERNVLHGNGDNR